MVNLDFVYDDLKSGTEQVYSHSAVLDAELNAPVYSNAVVMPLIEACNSNLEPSQLGGVETADKQFVNGTNIQIDTEEGYLYDNVEYRDEDILFIGCLHSCYGHMITDSISKLWYLRADEYWKNPKHLVCISLYPLKRWQYEVLELAGVDTKELEVITKLARFRSVQIPDSSQIRLKDGTHLYHKLFNDTIEYMIGSALKNNRAFKFSKIYLTRSKWTRNHCDFGEELIIPYFKKQGYQIISPEQYSVTEQIQMMQGAEEIASTDCSCAHNAIFMKKGCNMVLLRKGLFDNAYSAMITSLRELNTTIIDCSLSVINRMGKFSNTGPFFIYVNDNLSHYFGITKPFFPFRKFKRYLRESWRYVGSPENYMMEEVYARILSKEFAESRQKIRYIIEKVCISPRNIRKKISKRLSRYCMDFLLS